MTNDEMTPDVQCPDCGAVVSTRESILSTRLTLRVVIDPHSSVALHEKCEGSGKVVEAHAQGPVAG